MPEPNYYFLNECFSVGKQLPDSLGFDKQFLAAPIKSTVDKYQLVPEFLKVCVCVCVCILCMYVCMCKCFNCDMENCR